MSMGTKSPLYLPFNPQMVERLAERYPRLEEDVIADVVDIMTDYLYTETLLMVAICDMLDRKLAGELDEDAAGEYAAGIKLSAVAKSGTYKLQTAEMKLLHDVVVELQMAGQNYDRLQEYLSARFGLRMVTMHSCGAAMVAVEDADAYYRAVAVEQEQRTRLDWTSVTRSGVPVDEALSQGYYTQKQADEAANICSIAAQLVGQSGGEMTQPRAMGQPVAV